jgi:eukaryotic-like serine/threonine-protein kinase
MSAVVEPNVTPRTTMDVEESGSSGGAGQLLSERYEILGLVGVGGMGSVYRARDRELSEVVALKMLRRDLVDMPGMLERFRLEVKLARRVTHRNVARVFDIGDHQGEKFLTMEFIDGESLATALAREGRFDVPRALSVASVICEALASAHAAGVVHRDLKPDNVLLAKDGRVVVTDFGIARALIDADVVQTMGGLVGTPAYMAPEQAEGQRDIDARADIYALGALLYELFTGQRAWTGETAFAVVAARLTKPPPDPWLKRPDLPRACADLVLRCMARRREDRFATIEQMAAELSLITLPGIVASSERHISVHPPVTVHPESFEEARTLSSDKAVAVLPFRNAGPPEDEYLAEELTDDLIDALSMTRGLKIRSRGAVLQWKGVDRDAREVGRELDVQVVVEGSVRRARGNVRISARLTSVAEGFQLWAKRFDRPEQDVLSINEEAACAIAEALTASRDARVREAPSDPAAVDLYLRARHAYREFWLDDPRRALTLFEEAEALAPGDPLILSGKALAMSRYAFFSGDGAQEALAVARRAVAVAPTLAEGRLALGSALLQAGDWKAAVRELRHAVEQGPGLAEAHGALGRLLAEAGALSVGMRFLETALALDPQVPLVGMSLARSYSLLGEWERAEACLQGTEGSVPQLAPRVRILIWRRDRAGLQALLEKSEAQGDAGRVGVKMLRHIVSGELPQELAIFPQGRGDRDARRLAFLRQMEAEAAAFLGDDERALSKLQESVEGGLFDLAWMDRCPLFDALRADPRFAVCRVPVAQRAEEILRAYQEP